MSEIKIINGQSLPNIPWQERPADLEEGAVLWRYTENPVMGRNPTPKIGRIFNSAVVPWQDGYIAVLRGEQVNGVPHVYLGRSKDGIRWNVDRERVQFVDENGEPWMPNYAYDPRLVKGGGYLLYHLVYGLPRRGYRHGEDEGFRAFHAHGEPVYPL